ncbi:hypothetical protein PR048_029231 [Dryococelus australis]|uniref:Uncharacterized protein n=1 Tax=Dryococelus australis TaxID=614101 RepID=A0ABQ9GCU1_9NEOP|nr:hypothetical protein PR048_029231 [Dryococelus australis]
MPLCAEGHSYQNILAHPPKSSAPSARGRKDFDASQVHCQSFPGRRDVILSAVQYLHLCTSLLAVDKQQVFFCFTIAASLRLNDMQRKSLLQRFPRLTRPVMSLRDDHLCMYKYHQKIAKSADVTDQQETILELVQPVSASKRNNSVRHAPRARFRHSPFRKLTLRLRMSTEISNSAGAVVAERLARLLASQQGEPGSWESCRRMPLVIGFSRGYPVSPAPSFRRRSIFTSITIIGSQDLAVKGTISFQSLLTVQWRCWNERAARVTSAVEAKVPPASRANVVLISPARPRMRVTNNLVTSPRGGGRGGTDSNPFPGSGSAERARPCRSSLESTVDNVTAHTSLYLNGHTDCRVRGPRWCSGQTPRLPPGRYRLDSRRGRCVFSWISRFPCPFIPSAAPHSHRFTLIGSRHLDVKSRWIRRRQFATAICGEFGKICLRRTLLRTGKAGAGV